MTDLPRFIDVNEQTRLAGIPLARPVNVIDAKRCLHECRIPVAVPPGHYLRVAHDQSVAILESVPLNSPRNPRIAWVTRTRNLLPRRTLYSRELPIEVSSQDLSRPSVHPNAPSHLSSVWHYMADWKFEHMLETSAIFLCRADLLSDVSEGSISIGNLRNRAAIYRDRYRKMAVRYALISRELANIKRWTYVSCWRKDERESMQSWRHYLRGNNGVAIKVNYRRFLDCTATIFCSGVDYIEHEQDWVCETNPLLPFTYKQKSYAWEREFRLIIQRFPTARVSFDDALFYDCAKENSNIGLTLKVDLSRLIDKIVIAPHATEAYAEELDRIVTPFGLADRVRRSELRQNSILGV